MKNLFLLVVLFCFSCSEYKTVLAPMKYTPPAYKNYFAPLSIECWEENKKKYPMCSKEQIDSMTIRQIGDKMLALKPEHYIKLEKKYIHEMKYKKD